jgi:hypothetical protein
MVIVFMVIVTVSLEHAPECCLTAAIHYPFRPGLLYISPRWWVWWAQGSDAFADDPPNAIVNGTYTHDDGTTSQCSIEVELMAAPEPGADGEWTWAAIELTRWEGCPDAAQTTVVLAPSTIFIGSFSPSEPICPSEFSTWDCDDGSTLCWNGEVGVLRASVSGLGRDGAVYGEYCSL